MSKIVTVDGEKYFSQSEVDAIRKQTPSVVTDNSDVACLSLNDLLEVWADGGKIQLDKSVYKESPLYNNFERKALSNLKKNIQ